MKKAVNYYLAKITPKLHTHSVMQCEHYFFTVAIYGIGAMRKHAKEQIRKMIK
jgi:hypothetical protein